MRDYVQLTAEFKDENFGASLHSRRSSVALNDMSSCVSFTSTTSTLALINQTLSLKLSVVFGLVNELLSQLLKFLLHAGPCLSVLICSLSKPLV